MANTPDGFRYLRGSKGEVTITHRGRPATTLRGVRAQRFLAAVTNADPQELMARLTGNYKHGNERTARTHPRNST